MEKYILYFDMSATVVSFLTLCLVHKKKDIVRLQNIIFTIIVAVELCSSIFDIISASLINSLYTNHEFLIAASISNYLYYLAHSSLAPLLAIYVLSVTKITKKRGPWFYTIYFTPYLIMMVSILLNPFLKWVFYFNSDYIYERQWFLKVIYVISFFYIFSSVFYLIRNRNTMPSTRLRMLIAFLLVGFLSVIIQSFLPKVMIEMFLQSVMTLGILITIENPAEVYNLNTGLLNYRKFKLENIAYFRNNVEYEVIYIKLTDMNNNIKIAGRDQIQKVESLIAKYLVSISDEDFVYDCDNKNDFAIIVSGMLKGKSDSIIEKIKNRFEKPWQIDQINLYFKVELILIKIPEDASSYADLEIIINSSEHITDDQVTVIRDKELNKLRRVHDVELAIKRALDTSDSSAHFEVHYQPIWDAHANKIRSAEALIRMKDNKLGPIFPDEFIPLAEKTGLITTIGQFVFEEVCHNYIADRFENLGLDYIEVNLSPVQCMRKELPGSFKLTLDHFGLSAKKINLEITESAAISGQETFHQVFQDLLNSGFTFSLDDYGTGYSQQSYIFQMDFKIIKIDKSILWDADKNMVGKIILQNTIRMIKEMNLKVLVEGVETEEHKNLLTKLGCDYCQGYLFSKPLPKDQFIEFCQKFNFPET